MKRLFITLAVAALLGPLPIDSAMAGIWCDDGYIYSVTHQLWDEERLEEESANIPPPVGVQNLDYYLASMAGASYCSANYAGGGLGGPWESDHAGEVSMIAIGPADLFNISAYDFGDGLEFECHKCFSYPIYRPEK